MRKLGFDEVWFDSMGNIVGRIGDGPRKIVFDSHIDTVGIGNPDEWDWDPFIGKVEKGRFYARGACDEKGSTPPMIYGMAIARDLGLLDGWTAYYFGNMEEWCDGIAPHAFVEHEGIRPDFVVIGEPTKMQVYRGHKGRVEIEAISHGRSAHAASNHLGDNAIYKILPLIEGVSKLEPQLGDDPFLGHGKITVSDMKVNTPSINAVPDLCTVYIDRRVTFGETRRGRRRPGARPGCARTAAERPGDRRDDEIQRPQLHRFCLSCRQVFPGVGAGREPSPGTGWACRRPP